MSELRVNLLDNASIVMALAILGNLARPVPQPAEEPAPENPADALDDMFKDETVPEEDDGLGDLLGEEPEPEGVTVDDMKATLQALIAAKGKDTAVGLVKKVFAKLGVQKMDDIPEDKRETFVKILSTATSK